MTQADPFDLTRIVEVPSAADSLIVIDDGGWDNACVNWTDTVGSWTLYATGYKDAADILVAHVLTQYRQHDTLVYPIAFLYRQYLELSIKYVIRQARWLLDISDPLPKTHDISELWRICHNLLLRIEGIVPDEELKQIARLIGEFSAIDRGSIAFRYPEDKDGNPSLSMHRINLRILKEGIEKMSVILDGTGSMVHEYLQYKLEETRSYRSDY